MPRLVKEENWCPVPGYEGRYEVSDLGRVRSVDRIEVNQLGRTRFWRGRLRKLTDDSRGYLTVRLYRDDVGRNFKVHRLVTRAFIGPCPEGSEVRHLDGDSTNACLSNLVYGSHSENVVDIQVHGRNHQKRKTHCPQGHEYTSENTSITGPKRNSRRCKSCKNEQSRRRRARRIG